LTTLLLQQMRDEERNYDRGSEESNESRCALRERKILLYDHQEQYCYAVDRYMCA